MRGEEIPNANVTTKITTIATRKEKFVEEKEHLYKIIQNDTASRTASDRRKPIILHHELLKPYKQERRTRADRRKEGKEIKSVYTLKW